MQRTSTSHDLSRRAALGVGIASAVAGATASPRIARAQASDTVRYSFDFRIYGSNAPFFLAAEKGVFKDLNLSMQMDGSSGSGDAVNRVATGTHDFALADLSTLVEFIGRNPAAAPRAVMTIYDKNPAVVLSLKRKPISTFKDLAGATIAVGSADAGSKLLPALLKVNDIDPTTVNKKTVDVKLRDTLLLQHAVDGIVGFDYTSVFNLIGNGLKLDELNLLYFSDAGFKFWGASLITTPTMIERKPDLVRRVALATARTFVLGQRDRAGAISALIKRDALLDADVERMRMDWIYDKLIMTPNVVRNGFGPIADDRMASGLSLLADALGVSAPITSGQVFDGRFLPPQRERMFT